MIILYQKFIKREDLQSNPNVLYIFGDNLVRQGYGGQAAEMRGEPNAVGVPTKVTPDGKPEAFMDDEDFEMNTMAIDLAFKKLQSAEIVVIPYDGVGTGLARLKESAPRTWEHLNRRFEEMGATNGIPKPEPPEEELSAELPELSEGEQASLFSGS